MYGLDTETRAQASPIIGPHRLLEPLIGHHPLAPLKQSPRLKSEPNIGTLLYLAQVARFTGGNVPIWLTNGPSPPGQFKWSGDTCPNTHRPFEQESKSDFVWNVLWRVSRFISTFFDMFKASILFGNTYPGWQLLRLLLARFLNERLAWMSCSMMEADMLTHWVTCILTGHTWCHQATGCCLLWVPSYLMFTLCSLCSLEPSPVSSPARLPGSGCNPFHVTQAPAVSALILSV